ncbi:MAG: hypothetical protein IPK19_30340 [Chloroflexi bacterium]|nr:hypothetical protein [Chloroflexota bacterium]
MSPSLRGLHHQARRVVVVGDDQVRLRLGDVGSQFGADLVEVFLRRLALGVHVAHFDGQIAGLGAVARFGERVDDAPVNFL